MLDLLQDIVAMLGLVAAAIGAGGVAVVIAKQAGLDARFLRVLRGTGRSPERVLDLMVRCAELARREGLLRVEAEAAGAGEPLLERGVSLALDGCGEKEIRSALDGEIEARAERGASRTRLLGLLGLGAQAGGIVMAVGLLMGCLALAGGLGAEAPGTLLLLGGTTGLLAIVAGSLWSDAAGRARAAEVLCDLIIAEGVVMLRAGRDEGLVAQSLSRLLPPEESRAALARAA